MGKQVNFYMTSKDEDEFVAYVRSDRNVEIFKHAIPTNKIPFLEELPMPGEPFWWSLYFWDKDHSPPPVLNYIKEQDYFVANTTESEVIEFSRCNMDEGRLVRGRIWAEMTGWRQNNPAILIKKSESFRKWFDRLASWIKRRSVRNAVGDYLLRGAAEYKMQGGVLSQVTFAGGLTIPEALARQVQ